MTKYNSEFILKLRNKVKEIKHDESWNDNIDDWTNDIIELFNENITKEIIDKLENIEIIVRDIQMNK